ncbi:MAG: hypothetical protein ACKOA8_00215, partial [Deltaproteobacteria bacterium]
METKTQIELEKAKEYFYQLKLIESYNILRRFFDRLPFKPEPQHGEYIGMFIRVLSELGKKNELSFYVTELEKLEPKIQSPMISYQLAVAYVNADPPQLRLAVSLLEKFLKTQIQGDFIAKAKMTLAYCYDSISKDTAAVRKLIFSIEQIEEKSLSYLLETWKAKVLRDEGNYVESEKTLNLLLSYLKPEMDWYSYFTAKIISIGLYRDWGKMNLARQLLVETTQLSKEKPLRTVVRQLTAIRESFVEPKSDEPMILKIGNDKEVVCYQNHEFCFDNSKAFDKLTKLF